MSTTRNAAPAGKALRRFTRKLRVQILVAGRVSRKRKNFLDRLLTRLLDRAIRPKRPGDDYMRDELVDAQIGFTADELERYQSRR